MKYKVGDRVRIKSLDWYNENKDEFGNIDINEDFTFYADRSKYCGKVFTIDEVFDNCYTVKEDNHEYYWTDEMFEGLVEKKISIKLTGEAIKNNEMVVSVDEYILPEGYIIKDENGNVIKATKIVLEKKTNKEMNEDNKKIDMGEVSDGYHTFNELYEYRMLYNAALFNEFAKQGLYDVHKSRKHSDGEYPFGDSNWFIVMAELPTGQISNHYEIKDWDKFQIPEKPLANKWDEHSPKDVAERLTHFTNPKKEYPKTYEECEKVLRYDSHRLDDMGVTVRGYKWELIRAFQILLICRDAYWKIAGEEMGLGKPWEPDWEGVKSRKYVIVRGEKGKIITGDTNSYATAFAFPTEEMRDAFYENFKELIEQCKELL